MKGRVKLGRGLVVSMTAALCLAGGAAAVQAATLHVSVTPKFTHSGGNYAIQISGTVSPSQAHAKNKPLLLAWIQYSSQSCASTAQTEFTRLHDAKPIVQARVSGTSFHTKPLGFTAGSPGTRRVCAYLYAHYIGPKSSATPIARASAKEVVS
jgi:hypothetical protein